MWTWVIWTCLSLSIFFHQQNEWTEGYWERLTREKSDVDYDLHQTRATVVSARRHKRTSDSPFASAPRALLTRERLPRLPQPLAPRFRRSDIAPSNWYEVEFNVCICIHTSIANKQTKQKYKTKPKIKCNIVRTATTRNKSMQHDAMAKGTKAAAFDDQAVAPTGAYVLRCRAQPWVSRSCRVVYLFDCLFIRLILHFSVVVAATSLKKKRRRKNRRAPKEGHTLSLPFL